MFSKPRAGRVVFYCGSLDRNGTVDFVSRPLRMDCAAWKQYSGKQVTSYKQISLNLEIPLANRPLLCYDKAS